MAREPLQPQDKYVLRMPDGMRDRIKKAAERSGRSMNAEIIAALETFYPEEPSIEEVLDRVHGAIDMATHADNLPYRKVLLSALDELSERLSSGLEFDQFRAPLIGEPYSQATNFLTRLRRWRRAQEHGVETDDVERELKRGMLRKLRGNRVKQLLEWFDQGKGDRVLKSLYLDNINFADRDAALKLIEQDLRAYFAENWEVNYKEWSPFGEDEF